MDISDTIPIDSAAAEASDAGLWSALRLTVEAIRDRCAQGRAVVHIPPVLRPYRMQPIPHFHHHVEVFLQASGSGDMELAEGSFRYRAGDLLIIPPGVAHREHPSRRGGPFWNFVLCLPARRISTHISGGLRFGPGRIRRRGVLDSSESGRLHGYLHEALALAQGGRDPSHAVIQGQVLSFLALLADVLSGQIPATVASDVLVARARVLVAQYLSDQRLSVAWLAWHLQCSSDHLSRRFRAATGRTLVSTIVQERLALARSLLRDSKLGVAEVAHACGIADAAYFSRIFARETGRSPRVWRASH